MTRETIIIILESSVVASVVTVFLGWFKELYFEKKKKEAEREEKLYAPLKLYLLRMKLLKSNREQLRQDKDKRYKELPEVSKIPDKFNKMNEEFQKEIVNPTIKQRWQYIEKLEQEILK